MEKKEIAALTEQIDQIAETVTSSLQKSKKEVNDKVTEEVKSAKEEISKETKAIKEELSAAITILKTEAESAKKKAEDAEAEVTTAKNENQKLTVKIDEMEKKLNSSNMFGRPGSKGQPFDVVLKEKLEEHTDELMKIALKDNGRNKNLSIELKAADILVSTNYTGGSRALQILEPGIHMFPRRKVHMRQIVPGGAVGQGTQYVFMKESAISGAPAMAAEGAFKPQIDETLLESSVNIEVLAAFLRVTRKAMNNIPGFISFLQARLPERVLRVEDAQILSGTGVSPQLKGLMTAGNFTASTSNATTLVDAIIDDLALLEDTNERDASAIILRPKDYYGFFKNKAAGSGEYDLPENVSFVNGVLYISGVPVYQTTAMPNGNYLIADFPMGCQFLTQEGMRLEFFEQDSTNVQENKVTVRIEESVSLPVYGSDFFVVGNVPVI